MAIILLLSFTACNAQVKNARTESVKIYGNCAMCESTIEKAGNIKKVAQVDWNKDTKMAALTFDPSKTSQDEILKRIALAGYDSDQFLAPDDAYSKLPECCQYERKTKVVAKMEMSKDQAMEDHSKHNMDVTADKPTGPVQEVSQLKDLKFDTEHIEETKVVGHQRDHFNTLSDNMYQLLKVSKQETPTFYQHCPMANNGKGANWLSKENAVKNPYYGSQMLTCGKTVETID